MKRPVWTESGRTGHSRREKLQPPEGESLGRLQLFVCLFGEERGMKLYGVEFCLILQDKFSAAYNYL